MRNIFILSTLICVLAVSCDKKADDAPVATAVTTAPAVSAATILPNALIIPMDLKCGDAPCIN